MRDSGPIRVKVTGSLSYQIETDEGLVLRRHVDQLRRQYADETSESDTQLPSCVNDEWVGQDGLSSNFPIPVSLAVLYPQLMEQLLFDIPPSLFHQLTLKLHLKGDECGISMTFDNINLIFYSC